MADLITAKALREERAPLAHQIKAMNDKVQAEKREFNAEETANWEKLNSDYNTLTARIQAAERTEAILSEQLAPTNELQRSDADGRKVAESFDAQKAPVATAEDHALALQAWARVQSDMDLKPEHEQACKVTGINVRKKTFEMPLYRNYNRAKTEFRNALSGNSGVSGGFTKPEGFIPNLEQALLYFAEMRQVADVMRTADGNPLSWPTADNTSNTGYIVGESESNTTQQQPTFGRTIFSAYEYTSGFIRIPNSLLVDSAFDLAALSGQMQGEQIGRAQATDFTTGSGVNRPTGFVTSCVANSATSSAASATAIAWDDIFGLKHSIDPAYRRMGCQFMMHDSILLIVRKLKDGQGRYLWQSSLSAGMPDTIDGDPIFINQAMDSTVASGKYTIAYGAFSKYKIRDAGGAVLRRVDERYIENNQTGFIAFLRSDGNLLDAGRKPIKLLSH